MISLVIYTVGACSDVCGAVVAAFSDPEPSSPGTVIFTVRAVSSQFTENSKLSAIYLIGSIVRSFIVVGATSRVEAASFRYAVALSITSLITSPL